MNKSHPKRDGIEEEADTNTYDSDFDEEIMRIVAARAALLELPSEENHGDVEEALSPNKYEDEKHSNYMSSILELQDKRIMRYTEENPRDSSVPVPSTLQRAEERLLQSKEHTRVILNYIEAEEHSRDLPLPMSSTVDTYIPGAYAVTPGSVSHRLGETTITRLSTNPSFPAVADPELDRDARTTTTLQRATVDASRPGAFPSAPQVRVHYTGEEEREDASLSSPPVEAQPVDDEGSDHDIAEAQPVDTEARERRKQRHRTRLACLIARAAVIVLILVVAIVVWRVTENNHNMDKPALTASSAPTLLPTTESPSMAPSRAIASIISDLPSKTLQSLQDPFSPQSKAFDWLSYHRDIAKMEEWRKKQLFALATFYFSFNGPDWPFGVSRDWLDDSRHECEWFSNLFGEFGDGGVVGPYKESAGAETEAKSPCNVHREYKTIFLAGVGNVAGQDFHVENAVTPPEIGLLTSLETFYLNNHDFRNTSLTSLLPLELLLLPRLTTLHISFCSLTGKIPMNLGLLTNLKSLTLIQNYLSGTIPSDIWGLNTTILKQLELRMNLLSGTIPTELGDLKMTSLASLHLGDNLLSGTIPTELGNLQVMNFFLQGNSLSGSIPPSLSSLQNATFMGFYMNALTGQFPSEFGLLNNLETLSIRKNMLSGPIPSEIGLMTKLELLRLENNLLSGMIPTEIGSCGSIQILNMGSNALSGPIPSELGRLTALKQLHVNATALTGPIPPKLKVLLLTI